MTNPGIFPADGIARFALDTSRPVPLLDRVTLERLRHCIASADRSGARVLVITGGTQGVFSSGADLAQLATLAPAEALAFSRHGQALFDSLQAQAFVSIAVIRGRCIGGAFDLAMACDVRLADTTASFSHTGPRLGFITGYGGTTRLPELVGRASRTVLSGRRVLDSDEALGLGLIAEATRPDDLDRRTEEIAGAIARVPVERIRCIKEVVRRLAGSASRRRLENSITRLAAAAGLPSVSGP